MDDQYAVVENAPGPLYPPTHKGQDLDVIQFGDYPADYGPHTAVRLRSQDTIVPVKMVQMSTYPMITMQDEEGVSEHVHGEPGKPITANVLFGRLSLCRSRPCTLSFSSSQFLRAHSLLTLYFFHPHHLLLSSHVIVFAPPILTSFV